MGSETSFSSLPEAGDRGKIENGGGEIRELGRWLRLAENFSQTSQSRTP